MSPFVTRSKLIAMVAAGALGLALGACGDDNGSGGNAGNTLSQSTTATDTQTQTQTTPAPSGPAPVEAKKVTPAPAEASASTKPKPQKGTGSPPSKLEAEDLIVGKGAPAKEGDTVSVQYVGVLFKNGKEFDSSWQGKKERGQPFQFQIGAGQVIPGWDKGVAGMRTGGRRKLIIPADLAYGSQGSPPTIPPNAALIFDIDMEKAGT
jgi:FKBP-type peptidyl-prolyl cis-trans isomerase